tara:strand:+ start:1815 stop:3053 length:1239 start_codon:yes stop_codon:yes gene_type:complete
MHKKSLLIIGYNWPEPATTAAGNRMMQLIHFFKERDYTITFASTATKGEHSSPLHELKIPEENILLNDSGFDDFVKNLNPTIVLFDRFLTEEQFGWRVAEFAPNALRILDTEDLHSLRVVRQELFRKQVVFAPEKWLVSDITKREIASIYRCDLSLIISSYEMELLWTFIKIDKQMLLHLPFQLEKTNREQTTKWPSFCDRKDFICIGNGKHAPNVDAVLWLKKEIWPLIRKQIPSANLHIYGNYMPQQVKEMHDPKTGFLIEGWAKCAHTVMKTHRVNLAPIRFGAGIKGKLIDAMQSGTPSVTTSIGAEGMHGSLPWNGHIAESAKEIADYAITLYRNEPEWSFAQQNGFMIIDTFYNKATLDKSFEETIEALQTKLEQHRTYNFIGAMLRHQSMASTKFLSKWIQEKNK